MVYLVSSLILCKILNLTRISVPADDPEAVIVATARRLDSHNFPLTQVSHAVSADASMLTFILSLL